jgi:hypothetical protein
VGKFDNMYNYSREEWDSRTLGCIFTSIADGPLKAHFADNDIFRPGGLSVAVSDGMADIADVVYVNM